MQRMAADISDFTHRLMIRLAFDVLHPTICWRLKFQYPNIKSQINTKHQISNNQTESLCRDAQSIYVFGILELELEIYLEFGTWDLLFFTLDRHWRMGVIRWNFLLQESLRMPSTKMDINPPIAPPVPAPFSHRRNRAARRRPQTGSAPNRCSSGRPTPPPQ
jgi:hypothetical protein